MTAVETRLERIEQMNGITPPPKPATTDDGIASTMTVKGKDCFGRSFGQ